MLLGHYATALVPHHRLPRAPVWLWMAAANLPDFVWLVLAALGLETPRPTSILQASFANLRVDMRYSHDLLPLLGLAALAGGAAYLLTRDHRVAGWCVALVVLHEMCDLLAGFPHHVVGPDSALIGLNLYGRAPELALLLDAGVGAACVWWFVRAEARAGRRVAPGTRRGLYALFVLGTLMWLPAARTPLAVWLGLR